MTTDEFKTIEARGFVRQPDGSYSKVPSNCVPRGSKHEQNSRHESVGAPPRKTPHAIGSFVRIKIISDRPHLLDGDNLFAKYFIDALITAGVAPDDAPKFCQVEVIQIQTDKALERTEIVVEIIP